MNLGSVSICFVLMVIIATIAYEVLVLHHSLNLFSGLFCALLIEFFLFMIVYLFDSFYTRLIFLSAINVLNLITLGFNWVR